MVLADLVPSPTLYVRQDPSTRASPSMATATGCCATASPVKCYSIELDKVLGGSWPLKNKGIRRMTIVTTFSVVLEAQLFGPVKAHLRVFFYYIFLFIGCAS